MQCEEGIIHWGWQISNMKKKTSKTSQPLKVKCNIALNALLAPVHGWMCWPGYKNHQIAPCLQNKIARLGTGQLADMGSSGHWRLGGVFRQPERGLVKGTTRALPATGYLSRCTCSGASIQILMTKELCHNSAQPAHLCSILSVRWEAPPTRKPFRRKRFLSSAPLRAQLGR